ncbi:MAG: hypothetical protein SFV18_07275 [Bryobacteraceae bacterium]|nr:hypothetical protein [Bryobacteraceae bacterium]
MPLIDTQAAAILSTQWKILLNFYRRNGRVGFIVSSIFQALWYLMFATIAVYAAVFYGRAESLDFAKRSTPVLLFFALLYWQGMPLLLASIGGLLDLKKLRVYPVPESRLYRIELLLRSALFLEMPIVMLGMAIGLLRNPALPKWCALAPVVFTVFNLTLGAGLRDLLMRLFSNKRVREFGILVVVILAALPSLVAAKGVPAPVKEFFKTAPKDWLPWTAAAKASLAADGALPWIYLLAAAALAWMFGQWQFQRSLHFDSDGVRASEARDPKGRLEWMYSWPSKIFPDPFGALVEKEIRSLSRISRFRVVFFMGFSFGLLIWLPLATGFGRGGGGWMSQNFLSVVAVYAMMLLSEVCFYNAFGFDRTAAQMYYLTPVGPRTVLAAKNLAAAFFVIAEIGLVAAACLALRMPLTSSKLGEALAVCLLFLLCLLAIGNLGSTRSPRAMNPNEGWKRNSNTKISLIAFAFYPLISIPIGMAYLARYAFGTEAAFYAVIAAGVVVAGCFYWVAMDSAVETLEKDREKILTLLTQTDTPAV